VILLKREPALLLGFIAAAVKLLGYELNVSAGVQTAINAIAAGVVALLIAIIAKNGAWGAAILQTAQAVMSLFVGLGLDWSADRQALWMGTIAALLAVVERFIVTPPLATTRLEQSSPVKSVAPAHSEEET
jgi:quinol-cytochrome oxidoreductase complex cytochrome b subunit